MCIHNLLGICFFQTWLAQLFINVLYNSVCCVKYISYDTHWSTFGWSSKSIQIPISHMFGRLLYWLFHLRQHDVHQNPPDRPNPAKIGIPSASDLLLFQLLHGRHQLGLLCQGPGSFGGLQHRDTQLPTTDVEDLPRPQQGWKVILWSSERKKLGRTWLYNIVYICDYMCIYELYMWLLRSCF